MHTLVRTAGSGREWLGCRFALAPTALREGPAFGSPSLSK